jgi:leader peptidase (prepilin peptidase)/N-methyltransferase
LALVDLATYRLPDRLVVPLVGVALLGLGWTAIGQHDPGRLLTAVITGAAVLAGYFVLGLVTGRLGLGDVKLAGLIGLILGWAGPSQTALGALGGFATGAAVATGLLITRRGNRKSDFPFGPSMIIGAVLGLAFGPAVFPAL